MNKLQLQSLNDAQQQFCIGQNMQDCSGHNKTHK